jgi:hypothetical protein
MTDESGVLIGRFEAGTVDRPEELNRLIAEMWQQAVRDPNDSAQLAETLRVSTDELRSVPSPISARVGKSGFTGAEILIALAGAFAIAFAERLGEEAGRAAGEKVWAILYRRLRRAEPEAIGDERKSDDP